MKKQHSGALPDIFAQAMAALPQGPGIAIALSGGLDSSALLHLAQEWARERGVKLHAFHVHHGLSPNADAWLAHCEQACAALGAVFAARRVQLQDTAKSGTEAAARKSRYAALGALCREHGVNLLLTAHHLDDQAETVLLQLLRGSGPAGLSGMDACNHAPDLLGNADLLLARPLLQTARNQLEAYAAGQGIAYVNDESNDDPRYARNALRHQVMPALAQAFPGFQSRLSRSAQHAQSAQRMLTELAQQDLDACLDADSIALAGLRALSPDRASNMLRQWFRVRKLGMPSTAWLAEMLAQLLEAREDAQLLVTHPDCHVRRHRDRLYLVPKLRELEGTREDRFDDKPGQHFRWGGETALAFPAYGGTLHFDEAEEGAPGLDAEWLQKQMLAIAFRRGGERLKPAPNRPTRDLKHHYQSLSIPAWERTRLPVVYIPGQLLFAAGIGMDCHKTGTGGNKRIVLRWMAE